MALYSNSAFGIPFRPTLRLGYNTPPVYLFGSLNQDAPPMLFQIDHVSLTTNVATVTGTIKSGGSIDPNFVSPVVGAKMGVRGTASNSGAFNVDPTAVTAVTFTRSTGAISVSYALTHANVASTADSGDLVIQVAEVADLFNTAPTASQSAALIFSPDESDNARCLFAEARWVGTLPTAATVQLQVANVDDDGYGASPVSRWQTVENAYGTFKNATVAASSALATITTSAVTQSGANYQYLIGKFVRAYVSSITGGDATTGLIVTLFA